MFAQVYVIALTLAFSRFAFALAAACSREYTVQDGDYCDKISQEQNVSTYQLAAVNPSIDPDCFNLQVGQSICLAIVDQDCTTTIIVKVGDTCLKIAAANNLTLIVLRMNNPQLNKACDIYVGEVLCILRTVLYPSDAPKPTHRHKPALPPPIITSTSGSSSSHGPNSKSKSAPLPPSTARTSSSSSPHQPTSNSKSAQPPSTKTSGSSSPHRPTSKSKSAPPPRTTGTSGSSLPHRPTAKSKSAPPPPSTTTTSSRSYPHGSTLTFPSSSLRVTVFTVTFTNTAASGKNAIVNPTHSSSSSSSPSPPRDIVITSPTLSSTVVPGNKVVVISHTPTPQPTESDLSCDELQ